MNSASIHGELSGLYAYVYWYLAVTLPVRWDYAVCVLGVASLVLFSDHMRMRQLEAMC